VTEGPLIDIRGLGQVSRALREVTPELRRKLFADVGSMVKGRVAMGQAAAQKTQGYGRATGDLPGSMYLTKAGSKRDIGGTGKKGLFGFVAVSRAEHSQLMSYTKTSRSSLASTLTSRYGPAPRFLPGAFLGPGSGGGDMWAESRAIIERYIAELNSAIANAGSRVV
jgi:hypothetical protein